MSKTDTVLALRQNVKPMWKIAFKAYECSKCFRAIKKHEEYLYTQTSGAFGNVIKHYCLECGMELEQ